MNWAQIAFLAAGALAALLWAGVRFGVPGLSWLKAKLAGGGSKPAADDSADFMALKRLRNRFTVAKCPEGIAAVDVCTAHFWHGENGE